MGCNQSKATTTKTTPAAAKPQEEKVLITETVAIAAAVTVQAEPVKEVEQEVAPSPAKPVEEEKVEATETETAAPIVEEQEEAAPAAIEEEEATPAPAAAIDDSFMSPLKFQCPAAPAPTPYKMDETPFLAPFSPAPAPKVQTETAAPAAAKQSKRAKKHNKAAKKQAEEPIVADNTFARSAFTVPTPVVAAFNDENNLSPKRSALKNSNNASPARQGLGLQSANNANTFSSPTSGKKAAPLGGFAAPTQASEKRAVHFAQEAKKTPAKKSKKSGGKRSKNVANVNDEVYNAQIASFARLLTDASTLTRQLNCN